MSGTHDRNWMGYGGTNPDTSGFYNPPDPFNYDDILKFSYCFDARTVNKLVMPGRENCVDAVRGANYYWGYCQFADGAGVATMTIKGSIDGWHVDGCVIGKSKTWTDIELGMFDNYWYFGRPPTRNGRITNCTRPDGKPIRVWLWDAQKPVVENSNVRIIKVPALVWFPYFTLRYFMTKIGL